MPIRQHGLDARGQPRWVRERFDPVFYIVPEGWIAQLRSDGRRPSVHELLDNDRGGPLDGMLFVREVAREGKRFVVLSNNATIQFAIEIERDAQSIADAEIRALAPEEAWEIALEGDAQRIPPIELLPEPVRTLYDAARERRVVIFRRDADGSYGYEQQHFAPQSWVRDMIRIIPDAEQRNPNLWERAWQPSGEDPATRHETAEQALAEACAHVAWLAETGECGQGRAPRAANGPTNEEAVEIRRETNSTRRLEVKTRGLQFFMLILLGLLLVPLGGLLLVGELAKGSRLALAPLAIGIAPLVAYGAVVWLFRRAHIRSVRYFSDEGLVRNDGQSLAWADLGRVVDRIRLNRVTGVKYIWRTEIHFKSGDSAWLLPTKIVNFREVYQLVGNLPCEHTEVRA